MFLVFTERVSDSPFVQRVWRCHSERAGTFLSVAARSFEIMVTRLRGRTMMTLRGPETKVTEAHCPAEGEWFAIRLSMGTFMPHHPARMLMDRRDMDLPDISGRSFWLHGSAWEYPNFENAEDFVRRLVRAGLLVRDPAVAAALHGDTQALSHRSVQRHFQLATGMTHAAYRQIERARYATQLLAAGTPISDTVHLAGYFDQAHLARSLRRLIGSTPAKIKRRETQLSFLYKTAPEA